jgi:hypothetical protein
MFSFAWSYARAVARRSRLALSLGLALAAPALAVEAAPAPFDLAGPKLEISVTRAGKTLPIAKVANLAAGDELAIRPDLPAGESVHYLLVAAFLRDATTPPPPSWFLRTAAWKPKATLRVTVPQGAERALIFLAPQTGGDFRTVVGAVRARPGAFVRAAQELWQAGLDRSRVDAFTAEVVRISRADPGRLQAASPLLARALGVKLDQDCLNKVAEAQASCLTQDRDALVLNDAPQTSKLESLASGYSADIVRDLSVTTWAGAGNYSPYVASLFDIVHLLNASRTAQYQYIPALTVTAGERLSLLLNAPPSFGNPQSVLLAALPPIAPEAPPSLHPVDPAAAYCAARPDLVFPVDGAPWVFSTGYAHDLSVRLTGKSGPLDLPARADAARGGIAVDAAAVVGREDLGHEGVLTGGWGFASFQGPSFRLAAPRPQAWSALGGGRPSLVAGQESTLQLVGDETACVESVRLQDPSGAETSLPWSASAANQLTIHLPPRPAGAGDFKLMIHTYGLKAADVVPLGLYSRPSRIAGFAFHAGDHTGLLTGERLDEVQDVVLEGARFTPAPDPANSDTQLELTAADTQALQRFSAGDAAAGQAQLRDGRTIAFRTTVAPARPQVSVISRNLQVDASGGGLPIRLGSKDELPRHARLTFAVRAEAPTAFTGRETLEIETANGAFTAALSAADGLMLQDPQVAVASVDLQKRFGESAFGPLQFRIVKDAVASEWQALGVLVRLPHIGSVVCSAARDGSCALKGSNLFLIAAVAGTPGFEKPLAVPDGFAGDVLTVPRPRAGRLYLKLRDDPATVDTLAVSAQPEPARAAKPVGADEPG